MIADFRPSVAAAHRPLTRVTAVARQVADFLAANPAISRISILGDLNHPAPGDNTALTMTGFTAAWRGDKDDAVMGEEEVKTAVFALTSLMQAAFLRKELSKGLFGYDIENKEERDRFIGWIAARLFGGELHE
ncbi:hypothetical protein D3C75_817820 [compost metagenome]